SHLSRPTAFYPLSLHDALPICLRLEDGGARHAVLLIRSQVLGPFVCDLADEGRRTRIDQKSNVYARAIECVDLCLDGGLAKSLLPVEHSQPIDISLQNGGIEVGRRLTSAHQSLPDTLPQRTGFAEFVEPQPPRDAGNPEEAPIWPRPDSQCQLAGREELVAHEFNVANDQRSFWCLRRRLGECPLPRADSEPDGGTHQAEKYGREIPPGY